MLRVTCVVRVHIFVFTFRACYVYTYMFMYMWVDIRIGICTYMFMYGWIDIRSTYFMIIDLMIEDNDNIVLFGFRCSLIFDSNVGCC